MEINLKTMKILGYDLISDDGVYAKFGNVHYLKCPSYGHMPKHKRTVYFNRGYAPAQGVFMGIKEDWDTRTVYNGVVRNEEELKIIIENVR